VAKGGTEVVIRLRAYGDFVRGLPEGGIFAGAVSGTVVASLGIETAVAVSVKFSAVKVTIQAILVAAGLAAISAVVWIVTDSVLDSLAFICRQVILIGVTSIISIGVEVVCLDDALAIRSQ